MRDMSAPRSFGSAGSGLVRVVFPSTGRAPEREEEAAASPLLWLLIYWRWQLDIVKLVGSCWVTKPLRSTKPLSEPRTEPGVAG